MALPFPKKKNNFNSLLSNEHEGFWLKKAWRQGKKALAKANEPPKSRGLLFEALEPRVLMSAEYMLDTARILTVTGDMDANTIVIQQVAVSDTSVDLDLTLDGVTHNLTGVTQLSVNTAGGNDSIEILSAININASLDSGQGDDNLFAQADADFTLSPSTLEIAGKTFGLAGFEGLSLQGGASDNTFTVNDWNGSLTVEGGAGNDAITIASLFSAFDGDITISGDAGADNVIVTGQLDLNANNFTVDAEDILIDTNGSIINAGAVSLNAISSSGSEAAELEREASVLVLGDIEATGDVSLIATVTSNVDIDGGSIIEPLEIGALRSASVTVNGETIEAAALTISAKTERNHQHGCFRFDHRLMDRNEQLHRGSYRRSR